MDIATKKLINKFISGKRLNNDEFSQIDKLLNDLNYRGEIIQHLERNWQESQDETVNLQFEQIKKEINRSQFKSGLTRLLTTISKAAAVLFIPLLAATLFYYFSQQEPSDFLTLYTQKGEVTNIILPDSTKVWLNVDTKLSYPADFGAKSRKLKLTGEAYFEVTKNKRLPFEVTSGDITTTALGTQFLVSAYPEVKVIKSSLLEGSVEIEISDDKNRKILAPGQQLIFDKQNALVSIGNFNENYELSWKNKELVFQLTPFDDVINELEKWYDIKILYDQESFKTETLTVRFEKYETLENVLKVMSKVNEFNYSIENKQIKIKKRNL
ncbi:DUF4974 domain-containing protein [Maribellus comscasis]|uniref:DUF4974 domain-containing protein n=1 Tax=Maribellus comscasis TaxID=2681766 RepID=A0A6I6JQC8_9BACT|nr:FecR family protein [Maribellus comscasis]QGY42422.1 DUF4974 domain-containing protein [Maribellus comscasis]